MAIFKSDMAMALRILAIVLLSVLCVAFYLGYYAYLEGIDIPLVELFSIAD
jgi:hypothetical protein